MGTAYKIRCRHCQTEFQYSASADYGMYQECVGCSADNRHLETELPIRCPGCRRILNPSPEEFARQVRIIYSWD